VLGTAPGAGAGRGRHAVAVVALAAALALPAAARADDPALVSLDTATGLASPGWIDGEISEDGSIVAFTADSAALPGGGDGRRRIYLLDRTTATVTLVSGTAAGPGRANAASAGSDLTPDGRFVLFSSLASNLVDGDVNGSQDVFLFDAATGATTLVSRPGGSTSQHNASSRAAGLTADASRVLFITRVSPRYRARLRDVAAGVTSDPAPVSVLSDIRHATISDDGSTVAFSTDDQLTADDTGIYHDTYVRTLATGAVKRASRPPGTAPFAGDRDAEGPRLSADGAIVSFFSPSAALGGDGFSGHVYVRDLAGDTIVLADRAGPAGPIAEFGVSDHDLSRDGRYVTFDTLSTNSTRRVPISAATRMSSCTTCDPVRSAWSARRAPPGSRAPDGPW
jgi:TolB protein